MNEFLSDLEKEKIMSFNEDEVLVGAIEKVLLRSIYWNGTLRKDVKPDYTVNAALSLAQIVSNNAVALTNEQLGEDLRGIAQGVRSLKLGMDELKKIKKEEKIVESPYVNPGV